MGNAEPRTHNGERMRIERFDDINKVTLPPAQRAYGPEGTVNSEPVNANFETNHRFSIFNNQS